MAAFWRMHEVREAIPSAIPRAKAEFASNCGRLIKIGARITEHTRRILIRLQTPFPERRPFRQLALASKTAVP